MNILHVTPSFFPATYFGGPIFSTLGLCDSLARARDVNLRVLTTDTAGPAKSDRVPRISFPVKFSAGYEVFYCRKVLGGDFSFELIRHLFAMVRWASIVHLTGVYSPPTIPTLFACRLLGKPVVWSPRGSLQRWEGSTRPRLKQIWEAVCNCLIVPGYVALHVTSRQEAESSLAHIDLVDAVLIPNGVDLPELNSNRIWRPNSTLRVLFMGRLHPIKGVENLLMALADPCLTNTELVVYGDGDPTYRTSLRQLVASLNLEGRVSFAGEVKGEAKLAAFAAADVCVVPSFTENFGMVVAESLAHGVPVVVSKGAPWEQVEKFGCGLWVENTPEKLATALARIGAQDLASMGMRGRQWMQTGFGWDSVARRMYEQYQKLCHAN